MISFKPKEAWSVTKSADGTIQYLDIVEPDIEKETIWINKADITRVYFDADNGEEFEITTNSKDYYCIRIPKEEKNKISFINKVLNGTDKTFNKKGENNGTKKRASNVI